MSVLDLRGPHSGREHNYASILIKSGHDGDGDGKKK